MDKAALEDLMDMGDRVLKAIGEAAESLKDNKPTVTVEASKQSPPQVTVTPTIKVEVPEIKIPKPEVTVSTKSTSWKCEITERDMSGRVKSFSLTPL